MNERLKLIRKKLKLSQEEFGKRLGVTKASISRLEAGINKITEQMELSICREFNVNRIWFHDGEGGVENMFKKIDSSPKVYNKFGFIMENESPTKKAILSILTDLIYELPDEHWDHIYDKFKLLKEEYSKDKTKGES